jgi:hypothetical protein
VIGCALAVVPVTRRKRSRPAHAGGFNADDLTPDIGGAAMSHGNGTPDEGRPEVAEEEPLEVPVP